MNSATPHRGGTSACAVSARPHARTAPAPAPIDQSETPLGWLGVFRHHRQAEAGTASINATAAAAGTSKAARIGVRECVMEPPAGPWGPASDSLAHTCTRPGRWHPLLYCSGGPRPRPGSPARLQLLLPLVGLDSEV
jgi:hypothetical protein